MKSTIQGTIGAVALFLASATQAQIDTTGLQPVSPGQLPATGTFWSKGADGQLLPPMPCPPPGLDFPIFDLGNGQFLVGQSASDDGPLLARGRMTMSLTSIPDPGDGGDTNPPPPITPDLTRNYQKFMAHAFSLIDTNDAAVNDTNLYNFLFTFPIDTNALPDLQIKQYTATSVIIKANHFDYSSETRDFALLISDRVGAPTWKSVDLGGSSDAQDGWLQQGSVPNWKVTDPMYLTVSNINLSYSAFFRAIPYAGPEISLAGAQDYDTVSNLLSLSAAIMDLSGTTTTNQQLTLTVNGLPARYTLGVSNTISLDTRYAPSGAYQVVDATLASIPVTFDTQNPPMDSQLEFDSTATLSLDFENNAFLVNASDMCSPDVGTNYIQFGLAQPDYISVTISEPSSGRLLMTNFQYVATAGTVAIPWNFTEADGVTAYTNDTYAVHFVANDPTALAITNSIARQGVKSGAGVMITYAEENPASTTGSWLNGQAQTWIQQTLSYLYNDIYDQWGLTQYTWWDIGIGRNITAGYVENPSSEAGWRQFLQEKLGSQLYSDATIGPGHGNATSFGARGYATTTASSRNIQTWLGGQRIRKVAMWTCYSGENGTLLINTNYPTFFEAFGIPNRAYQLNSLIRKNAGLFFAGDISQGWQGNPPVASAQAEEALDELWVTGPNAGGCDPTWGFQHAVSFVLAQWPDLRTKGKAVLAGYYWLPYSCLYDDELMTNNTANIHQ
jgi:hypothetical protein